MPYRRTLVRPRLNMITIQSPMSIVHMALLSIILTVAHVELCTDRPDPCHSFLGTSQVPFKGLL